MSLRMHLNRMASATNSPQNITLSNQDYSKRRIAQSRAKKGKSQITFGSVGWKCLSKALSLEEESKTEFTSCPRGFWAVGAPSFTKIKRRIIQDFYYY